MTTKEFLKSRLFPEDSDSKRLMRRTKAGLVTMISALRRENAGLRRDAKSFWEARAYAEGLRDEIHLLHKERTSLRRRVTNLKKKLGES